MLAAMTAEIVAAFVANHTVATSELPHLIHVVGKNLCALGSPVKVEEEKPKPVVSIKKSVQPDHLVCLICGTSMKLLKRHLGSQHELSEDEYRQLFGLPMGYPMTAPDYSKRRSKMAKAAGLGLKRKPAKEPKAKVRRSK